MNLAGLRLRYLIGVDNAVGEDGAFTVVGYDATQPASKGVSGKYLNCFFEKYSETTRIERAKYGPYLHSSDTAQQYSEGQCDPKGVGFWRNVTDQLNRAVLQGFKVLGDVDNRDAYHNADVLKVYNEAASLGLSVIAKNVGMSDLDEDSTDLLKHPAVIGCIIEKSDVTPIHVAAMRIAAGKPELPVWFVAFKRGRRDGIAWARNTANHIRVGGHHNMGVTYSPHGEYTGAIDILLPWVKK